MLADVEQAKRLFVRASSEPDWEGEFKQVAKKILRAIGRRAPFSGEMIFLLRGQRHAEHPWIQGLLEI